MLSVDEALSLVLGESPEPTTFSRKIASIDEPTSDFTATSLFADRDMPPFDRVAMDGIAISFARYANGDRRFPIEAIQAAGSARTTLTDSGACIEVMTGAVLPTGCDTVIRYEDLHKASDHAVVADSARVQFAQNIHSRGSDKLTGDLLIPQGTQLLAPHWAIAATIGNSKVATIAPPKISIIATGDELISVEAEPLEHQIRASNTYAMTAGLRQRGFHSIEQKLVSDDPKLLFEVLAESLDQTQVCILTGAVSMGLYDHVPATLKKLGVREIFHRVKQRPGKPLWFGKTKSGTLVFGLPGNPVSSLISMYKYVLPALYKLQGGQPQHQNKYAQLTEDIDFTLGNHMTLFKPVRIRYESDGILYAQPIRGNGSGDLASLVDTDGFVECSEGRTLFSKGAAVPLYTWGLQ